MLFGKSQQELHEEAESFKFINQRRFEEIQAKRNEDLTDSILALLKISEAVPSVSKETKEAADAKIKELINKIN